MTRGNRAPGARPGHGARLCRASHRRAGGLLIVFSLVAFLPGFFQIPPVDRDEARFAQATKQMLESGEYIDIRFQDEVRYKKPVGIYWLQAVAVKAGETLGVPHAHTTIWLYRLPSLIGATGAVLLTYWTALAFVTPHRAGGSVDDGEFRAARRRGAAGQDRRHAAVHLRGGDGRDGAHLSGEAARAGPSGGLEATGDPVDRARRRRTDEGAADPDVRRPGRADAVDRRSLGRWIKALRPLAGIGWLIVLVLPWFVAIVAKSGDSFFVKAIGEDMLSKVTSGQEAHGAPPGYYLLLFWLTFWPGSILAGMAAPRCGRRGVSPARDSCWPG